MRAGLARERVAPATRQDTRDLSKGSTNSVSGIPPAGFAGLSRAGPAPTSARLQPRGKLRALFDGALSVQLGGQVGAADQVVVGGLFLVELAQ